MHISSFKNSYVHNNYAYNNKLKSIMFKNECSETFDILRRHYYIDTRKIECIFVHK